MTDKPSSAEQMVMVPREWVKNYAGLLEEHCAYEASKKVYEALAKSAEQHQGEPVAWIAECSHPTAGRQSAVFENKEKAESWASHWVAVCKLEATCTPLYPCPDAGELERLRAELNEWKKRCQYNADTAHDVWHERDTLRAQLAERDALLRLARQLVVNGVDLGYIQMPDADTPDPAHDLVPKIDAALSASAEPKPFTTPDCPDCACVQDGQCLCTPSKPSAEPSAPVERDEREAFQREGRYIVIKLVDLAKVPSAVGEPFAEQLTAIQRRLPSRQYVVVESDWPEYEPTWAAIQARAALERKP